MNIPGVDEVDWSALECAYGSAEVIPELLEDVIVHQTEDAVGELSNAVVHQGTIYSGSAPTIPILATMATAPEFPSKIRYLLMELIVWVSRGRGYWQVHRGRSMPTEPAHIDLVLALEAEWVSACRREAQDAADGLVSQLDDLEWAVWAGSAACVAANCAQTSPILDEIPVIARQRLDATRALCLSLLCDLRRGDGAAPDDLDELHRLDPGFGGYERGSDDYDTYLVLSLVWRASGFDL